MDAAEARRAANAAMVAAALEKQREKEEEEAYWASVRARREGREAQSQSDSTPSSFSGKPKDTPDSDVAAEVASVALSSIPVKVRPHYITLNAPPDVTEGEVRK